MSSDSSLCSRCKSFLRSPRLNIDLEALYTKLRSNLVLQKPQEVDEQIVLCDEDYRDYELEIIRLQSQILFIREQQEQLKHSFPNSPPLAPKHVTHHVMFQKSGKRSSTLTS
ncbi:hypothetical protein GYMLUDRAFT_50519 [Collybiopsis luxurians FD-317 M1]|uniref:Uncharacterized protein n=1 Tax=Collybiopsis luxurians FD-317 M1 TaxID=944289 RepID=A0A0D0BPJ8_9AGAR|nr:hypothetical protein GYMLUDRAFT_50519 [Collybiopsis luxurians FD-317 M1]